MTERRNDAADRAAIDRFFDRELMPLAKELKAGRVVLLDAALDPDARSYYVNRTQASPRPSAFEWGGADSAAELENALARMWLASERPVLARLAPSVARLAERLRRVEDQSAEVSEFVYVMY
jgi:hypothetical protein